MAHSAVPTSSFFTNRVAEGITECEQALSLDANMADAYGWIGLAKYFVGRAVETEGHILDAMRLSPRDTYVSRWMLFVGHAKVQMGAYEEAVVWIRRAIEANRNFPLAHFYLSACLGLLGLLDEAQAAARAGLRLEPSFTVRRFRVNAPSNDPI
jgi:tetratricopeptide (TPR) repeat protein